MNEMECNFVGAISKSEKDGSSSGESWKMETNLITEQEGESESQFIKLEPVEIEDEETVEDNNECDDDPASSTPQGESKDKCPPSLQNCTEEEIEAAFRQCYSKKLNLTSAKLTSFLGKVFTTLARKEISSYVERKYLYDLWLLKYKELLGPNKRGAKRKKKSCLTRTKNSKLRRGQKTPLSLSSFEPIKQACPDYQSTVLEPNDIIVWKSETNCPPSLQRFSEEEISTAFSIHFAKKSIRNYIRPNSFYGNILKYLTHSKTSSITERRYLYELWNMKYKHVLDQNSDLRQEVIKRGKTQRDKLYRRLKYQNQSEGQNTFQSMEIVHNNSNNPREKDYNNIKSSSNVNVSPLPLAPKAEIESDFDCDDGCSDTYLPSSPEPSRSAKKGSLTVTIIENPQLRKKPVVKLVRLEPNELIQSKGASVRRLTRHRKKNIKFVNYVDTLSNSGSDLERDNDDDYIPSETSDGVNVSININSENNSSNNCTKSTCSVCGLSLSMKLMSFHLRTHLSFEEQKQYLINRREKDKEIRRNERKNGSSASEQNKTSKESRLDQLKWLLEGRDKVLYQGLPPPKKTPKPRYIALKSNEKRDGNYGPVQCSHCGKVISTIYRLKAHKFGVHGLKDGKTGFSCSICGRPFGLKDSVSMHKKTHLNLDELKLFIKWPGSIEEFLHRLNTGEDLNKPPTRKQYVRKNMKPRVRRLPRKIGRPRIRHHLFEKKESNHSGAEITEQLKTDTLSVSMGVDSNISNSTNCSNDIKEDANVLNWNISSNVATTTSGFFS